MKLFNKLNDILADDCLVTIAIQKCGDRLVVSTNFRNNSVKDGAKDLIAPFIVSGSADELDAEFVKVITEPMEKSSGLQTSMKNFEAQEKIAKANAAQNKTAKAGTVSATSVTDAAFKKAMADAKTKKTAKKFKEAAALYEKALANAPDSEKAKVEAEIKFCKQNIEPDMFSFEENEPENPTTEPDKPVEEAQTEETPSDTPEETTVENDNNPEKEPITLDPEDFNI